MRHAAHILALLLLAPAAALAATTQPSTITLHLKHAPRQTVLEDFAKQAGAPMPLAATDQIDHDAPPPVTIDIERQPFWAALETLSKSTGLEPIVNPEDPYPRFQLVQGKTFWQTPHVVSGPLLIFANDVVRSNTVELRKTKGQFERQITVNLTVFAEPGLRVLSASEEVRVTQAIDSTGRALKPTATDDPDETPALGTPGNGLYMWNLTVDLDCPSDPPKAIAKLKALTKIRLQTASERLEIDDVLKSRNLTRIVAGVPFTFQSLKKADIEYVLRLGVRREKKSDVDWQNLHQSIYNGQMALYDEKSRLVAARATENGGDYANNRIDATLRFVREPGISDPNAGEPFKLVWLAPTQSKDVPIDFELSDLPIPD